MERRHILRLLESAQGQIDVIYGAVAQIGLNPSTLRCRMKKLGLSRPANVPLA